jgi:hypothetical protein
MSRQRLLVGSSWFCTVLMSVTDRAPASRSRGRSVAGRAPGARTGDSHGPEPEAVNLDVTADRKSGVRHRLSKMSRLIGLAQKCRIQNDP